MFLKSHSFHFPKISYNYENHKNNCNNTPMVNRKNYPPHSLAIYLT